MRYIFIGCFAVGLALMWDRLLFSLNIKQWRRICIGVPLGEEIIKFVFCYFFNLIPMIFYAVFGLGEGFYEAMRLKKPSNPLLLLSSGVFTHWSFSLVFLLRFPVMVNLIMAIISHMLWNIYILHSDKCSIG
jgi:hypothetical protein